MTATRAAEEELAARDPVLAALIDAAGPCPIGPAGRRPVSHFEYVSRSICFQQLAGNAARTIWGRVRALVPGPFTAPAVLSLSVEELRGAGLSRAKEASIRDLATRVVDGDVRLASIARRDDDGVIEELCRVRGIGPWTAQMFLLFHLGRLDVWPVTDYGVRAGVALAWDLPAMPSPKELDAWGARFQPFRSLVAWYAWRALDLDREARQAGAGEPTDR